MRPGCWTSTRKPCAGAWAQLEAKDHIGLEPGLLIAPDYTATRPGDAANPVATAMDAVCARIIDCMAVVDAPATREAAAAYAADFKTSLNIVAMYPAAKVWLGGALVVRPLSPHAAAAIVRCDKQVGNPFKAAWNRPLVGILGTSQRVTYRDGDGRAGAGRRRLPIGQARQGRSGMMALMPVMAARAFASGDAAALGSIPLTAGPGRAALRDMDYLPLVPPAAWSTYHCGVWCEAGLLEIDTETSRWRLTAAGRAAVTGERA